MGVPHSSWLPALGVLIINPTCMHRSCTGQIVEKQNSLGTGIMHRWESGIVHRCESGMLTTMYMVVHVSFCASAIKLFGAQLV